ncbi:hypothetical protein [Metabacillus malikii]|uniref:Uncharacterized protein n=1 Tax=Metabacillus malikii TaxID=1504265 RepID=A0ABT9ZAE2_9BACI|nr:hypothetical protein [Metabacillus malikii]MDQ0229225.1 hypothetical protein [Metabacillus malikii]
MKKIVTYTLFAFLLLTLIPSNCLATTLDKIPVKKSSNQWEVVIGKPDNEDPKANISDKPELYKFYSLNIKNIGDEYIELVRIEAFRDEPNINTEYELFTVESEPNKNLYPPFHHSNFPLYTKAKELKVVVTWIKEGDNPSNQRKYREQFVFKQ